MAITFTPAWWQRSTMGASGLPIPALKMGTRLLDDRREGGLYQGGHGLGARLRDGDPETLAEAVQHALDGQDSLIGDPGHVDGGPKLGMKPEVDAKGAVGERAHATNPLTKIVRCEIQAGEDPEPTRAADLGYQFGACDASHAGLENRILDAEHVRERGAKRVHAEIPVRPEMT